MSIVFDRLKEWWQTQRANGNANWSLSPAKRRAYATWDDDKFLRSLVIRRRLLYVWVCLALLVIFLVTYWLLLHRPPPDEPALWIQTQSQSLPG